MNIQLATDEKIIKEWHYAESGHRLDKGGKVKHSLTVTNKRIISLGNGKHNINYHEIPTADVKSISGKIVANGSFWAKLQLIISIPLCLLIIGIPMLIDARRKLRACTFDLYIQTSNRYGIGMKAGFDMEEADLARRHLFGNSLINRFKVTANKADAIEILSELGSILLDNK